MTSAARLDHPTLAPKAYQALVALHAALEGGSLGTRLLDLVYLRVSQLNGCAFCIDMHWRDLIAHDEDPRRLNALPGWREAPFFTARERAALQWAERLTGLVGRDPHAPEDAEFAELRQHFSEVEAAELCYAIAAINAWNRLGVGLRPPISA
ncbi:carboxymuconolactone decarboxylase family protein [Aquabacterium sp. A7-Y]|uniref:carboxymuconolactone decarboxylase family protein n=1 Tax=Aquabacterium sp. A7-Y TaxID=1349605 RepID=UPI00223DCDE8|nr:carboxymuconolactone decarboxylase family protein [Aquabacterium sp. A7-Y]MCW7540254.1 carboxymuconolactone decarboxylase family protein [Aquabacterium sp. A7-Y]